MANEIAKEAASLQALSQVQDGMHIGLGTGSTAAFFIDHLIEKCKAGLAIQVAATSKASEKKAKEGGLPLLDLETLTSLDLTVDGADEVDPQKRLIKGAGGALVREKILASMSKKMIVIVDETKLVDTLGHCPLPVEVIPFAAEATKKQLEDLGYPSTWRMNKDQRRYVTDNQNWILDICPKAPFVHPEKTHLEILQLPGVVETGFFFHLAKEIIVGKNDGTSYLLS
jgi:ribose 5-phosphate isomerase A